MAIENVTLPFRFKRLHTPKLVNWDGSNESAEFRKLVEDISALLGKPQNRAAVDQRVPDYTRVRGKRGTVAGDCGKKRSYHNGRTGWQIA